MKPLELSRSVDYHVLAGDCLEVMARLEANSMDAIVTDPPYGLGFMGKHWDHGVPGVDFWVQALRVLKPGGHLLAFGGTRTYHRLACAIEDAGFEIRDQIQWLYGSGFPKSLNVSAAIERLEISAIERLEISAIERRFCDWIRDSSGLTPKDIGTDRYHECRVEIVNTATIDAPRMGRRALVPTSAAWERMKTQIARDIPDWVEEAVKVPPGPPIAHPGQWKSGKGEGTNGNNDWAGWGTALKPANEPICLARKPLQGTVAANVLEWGTGAINVDGCRVGTEEDRPLIVSNRRNGNNTYGDGLQGSLHVGVTANGRWPANVIHDGSEEVTGLFPVTTSGGDGNSKVKVNGNCYGHYAQRIGNGKPGDTGSAARFFYCAKASKAERDAGLEGMALKPGGAIKSGDGGWRDEEARGRKPRHEHQLLARNYHPTVKPIALMRYLCRLITPPGGTILDPFCGSGSTGIAAMRENFRFIGIEMEAEYIEIARARIAYAVADRTFGLFDMPEQDELAQAAD